VRAVGEIMQCARSETEKGLVVPEITFGVVITLMSLSVNTHCLVRLLSAPQRHNLCSRMGLPHSMINKTK